MGYEKIQEMKKIPPLAIDFLELLCYQLAQYSLSPPSKNLAQRPFKMEAPSSKPTTKSSMPSTSLIILKLIKFL